MFRFTSAIVMLLLPTLVWADDPPRVERYLTSGKLAEGERDLTAHLRMHKEDDQARFGLGALQFLQAIEHLGQSLYEYGAVGAESRIARQIPLVRLAVPENPRPKPIRYADFRRIVQEMIDDLAEAEKTLTEVDDERVKLPLHFGLIALDMNKDGAAGGDETLWKIYAKLNGGLQLSPEFTPQEVQNFVICFDYGDVLWLRGYCHLLTGICEIFLAHDAERFFNAVAGHLFDNPAFPGLPAEFRRKEDDWTIDIADAVLGIHLASFKVQEPERMKTAHGHFKQVIDLSRKSWKAILAESDDDREWVPNSKQASVIPNVRVTGEMIGGWHEFLDEAEKMLDGKKLVPHWRWKPEHGVNLRRVFFEPKDFDLISWVHGAGALPFAEKGTVADGTTAARLNRMFGGQFIGFAFWFN